MHIAGSGDRACLNAQVRADVEPGFHAGSLRIGIDSGARAGQIVRHAPASPDQHGSGGVGREPKQNPFLSDPNRLWRGQCLLAALFQLVRSLPHRQLPKGVQICLREKNLQGRLRLLGSVHNASFQTVDQRTRSHVHHHHFVRFLHHPIRHRLANLNTCHLPNLVVQAFNVLHVDAGQNMDSRIENRHHILPSFGALRPRNIGVGKLVNDRILRSPRNHRRCVHIFERSAAVFKLCTRNKFQIRRLRNGFRSAMGLEIPHHNVMPGGFQALCLNQHLVGLAHPCCIAQKDF